MKDIAVLLKAAEAFNTRAAQHASLHTEYISLLPRMYISTKRILRNRTIASTASLFAKWLIPFFCSAPLQTKHLQATR